VTERMASRFEELQDRFQQLDRSHPAPTPTAGAPQPPGTPAARDEDASGAPPRPH